jgi:hypothetical protein
MFTLRRLFPSPAIIAFYSPDARPTRWGGRTSPPTAEKRCVLKLQKPVSLTFHLHILLGNRMALGASGVHQRFFRQKSDPNIQFGCRAEKLMHYSGSILGNEWKMTGSSIQDCRIVDLPKISERSGSITPIYGGEHVPFNIVRVFYLYDVPAGANRGGHANRHTEQLLIAAMGAFDVVLDDGVQRSRYRLDRPHSGLYIPAMIWRELENFSSGGICLVLTSHPYDAEEYIRDYLEFQSDKLNMREHLF